MARKKEPHERTVSLYPIAFTTAQAEDLTACIQPHGVTAVLVDPGIGTDAATALQAAGSAVLAIGEVAFDGAHFDNDLTALAIARKTSPDAMLGAGGVSSRHDAMLAAEAGADYVAFGRLGGDGPPLPIEQRTDLLDWWQSMMELPCIARAEGHEAAGVLANAGADFIAVGPEVWHVGTPDETISALAEAIRLTDPVDP